MDERLHGWLIFAVIAIIIIVGLLGYPRYCVYEKEQDAKADMIQSEMKRKTKVSEAVADEESAIHKANAKIIQAEAEKRAIQIIDSSLKNNEEYTRYMYVKQLAVSSGQREVIYVPTEKSFPIIEGGAKKGNPDDQ